MRQAKNMAEVYSVLGRKLMIHFRYDEDNEKTSLNSPSMSDFGLADSTVEDDKKIYNINLNIRLLMEQDGKTLRDDWREDLKRVIMPHEITHTLLDSIGKMVGLTDLHIGNRANEEIVDSIVYKDELGPLPTYRRIAFGQSSASGDQNPTPEAPVSVPPAQDENKLMAQIILALLNEKYDPEDKKNENDQIAGQMR